MSSGAGDNMLPLSSQVIWTGHLPESPYTNSPVAYPCIVRTSPEWKPFNPENILNFPVSDSQHRLKNMFHLLEVCEPSLWTNSAVVPNLESLSSRLIFLSFQSSDFFWSTLWLFPIYFFPFFPKWRNMASKSTVCTGYKRERVISCGSPHSYTTCFGLDTAWDCIWTWSKG